MQSRRRHASGITVLQSDEKLNVWYSHSSDSWKILISLPPPSLQPQPLQRALIRRLQHHLGNLPIPIPSARLKRLFPPVHAQAPLTPAGETGLAQVVASSGAEVEEFIG
jgi:hypothetical protein